VTKRIAYSIALIILLASFANAKDNPTSFLDDAVTFNFPNAWVVAQHVNTSQYANAQVTIPYEAAEKLKQTARVSLSANILPVKATVKDLSDGVYKNKYEGLAVLSDTFDGDNWRTIVWTARADVPYLMLHRFGVVGNKSVELWAALPLIENGDWKWLEKAVADFNAACERLKIDGQNKFENKLELSKISEQLKAKIKP
jgi:hypothetical protein